MEEALFTRQQQMMEEMFIRMVEHNRMALVETFKLQKTQLQETAQQFQGVQGAHADTVTPKSVETVLKRVSTFHGENFLEWKFKLEMALQTSMPEVMAMLRWIEGLPQGEEITVEKVAGAEAGYESYSKNLYYVLAQRTEKDPFDIIRNTAQQNGCEAWRKICSRFDNRTAGRRVQLVRRCINPGKAKKLTDLPMNIDRWEAACKRLSSDFDITVFDDDKNEALKVGILIEMLPTNFPEAVAQKLCDTDVSYAMAKDSITKYLAFREDSGPVPMDCSPLELGERKEEQEEMEGFDNELNFYGKGWDKGKGKGKDQGRNQQGFPGICHYCYQPGHKAAQCPSKPKAGCWNCGDPSHRAFECPSKGKGKGQDFKGKGHSEYVQGFPGKGNGQKGNFGKQQANGTHGNWSGTGTGNWAKAKGKGYQQMYGMEEFQENPLTLFNLNVGKEQPEFLQPKRIVPQRRFGQPMKVPLSDLIVARKTKIANSFAVLESMSTEEVEESRQEPDWKTTAPIEPPKARRIKKKDMREVIGDLEEFPELPSRAVIVDKHDLSHSPPPPPQPFTRTTRAPTRRPGTGVNLTKTWGRSQPDCSCVHGEE